MIRGAHALAERFITMRILELEVGSPYLPYDPSEWNGVDRLTTYRDINIEVDRLEAALRKRGFRVTQLHEEADRRFVQAHRHQLPLDEG